MYENARYKTPPTMDKPNAILVKIGGADCSVPLDPANADYVAIMALVAEGKLVIAEPEAR
jgi:hypothetical protein